MLAEAWRGLPPDEALPGGWVAEQKPDGFRVIVFARPGRVMVQSRQGADLTAAFCDIAAAAAGLGERQLVVDGELVVPGEGGLDFGRLQHRARRRGRSAALAAADHPAYLILFDVLETEGREQLHRPYRERRAVLEGLFADGVLAAPFTLCPATEDRAQAQEWLDPSWGAVGIEGVVLKGREQPYLPGKRAWIKVRSRITSEAVIGGVTGSLAAPATLLLGRYDTGGDLRLVARTTVLPTAARRLVTQHLSPGGPSHPWHGRRFAIGWGTRGELEYHPVQPDLVAEFVADTTMDGGRYRHPVRFLRLRTELRPADVPGF